ncbi:hypothetical protein GRI89_10175 [Altererythrobacter salegens]|uniref:Methyltransferase n=1 Tax=Croceibacterium salegens TaxID=1737568 RepID=A0A6I4SV61_9SPHN|nr:CmcJ/NvfI family oxidoreductase [Croceibacterium salegens]MXO59905.1 hypothetical protein [Croceibacterium salegens]
MGEAIICDVESVMKYVVRGEKATFHPGDRSKSYWPVDEHRVKIRDVRPKIRELSIERNGFVVVDEPTCVTDFTDAAELKRYCRQAEGVVRRLTGADKVVSFGPMLRSNATDATDHNQPAFGAHVDYGEESVADFTRELLPPDEAERRLERRHMLINVWRPIVMVESAPLAVCDARTVWCEDLFDSEVVGGLGDFNRRSLWGFNLAYHPGHRWYWVPHMQPWEALVFKLFDSDPEAIQFTAHSAFDDPNTPPDAAPRQSIEVRTIAYF